MTWSELLTQSVVPMLIGLPLGIVLPVAIGALLSKLFDRTD